MFFHSRFPAASTIVTTPKTEELLLLREREQRGICKSSVPDGLSLAIFRIFDSSTRMFASKLLLVVLAA
jgi:hypothetical protein